jgi:hypothetical protein
MLPIATFGLAVAALCFGNGRLLCLCNEILIQLRRLGILCVCVCVCVCVRVCV